MLTHAARRGGWTLADQIVSSGTNFMLLILLARHMPPAEFGAFALLYGYYVVCLQLAQTTFAEPLMVRFPRDAGSARRALRDSSGSAAAFGLLCAGALLPLSWPILGGITAPALIMAALLPALLVQSTLRMGFVAAGQPGKAIVSDAAWGLGQCVATLGVLSVTAKLTWVFLAWGIGGLIATGIAIGQAGVLPRILSVADWLREYGDLSRPYLVEGVVLTVCGYATLLVVGRISGLAAIGALRAADTLFGPATVVIGAGRVIAITELSRLVADRPQRIGRATIVFALGLAAAGGATGLLAMALPADVGAWLFGRSWQLMVPLLPAQTVYRIAQGAVLGPTGVLRAVEAVRALFIFRLASAAALVGAAAVGAAFAGAVGAATGLAGTMTLSCLYGAALYARYRHRITARTTHRPNTPANATERLGVLDHQGAGNHRAQANRSADRQDLSETFQAYTHPRAGDHPTDL